VAAESAVPDDPEGWKELGDFVRAHVRDAPQRVGEPVGPHRVHFLLAHWRRTRVIEIRVRWKDPQAEYEVLRGSWLRYMVNEATDELEHSRSGMVGYDAQVRWVSDKPDTSTPSPSSAKAGAENPAAHARPQRGRKPRPEWELVEQKVEEWLKENGEPIPGDGTQAELERYVSELLEQHKSKAAPSTIRRHVTRMIKAFPYRNRKGR
jgi:hypothetical protein